MSRAHVFEGYKRFCEGQTDVKDYKCSKCPSTLKTTKNIQKIEKIFQEDCWLSIRLIAEMVSIDKETVQQILHDNLHMTKAFAKVIPKLLTCDQKEKHQEIGGDILKQIEAKLNIFRQCGYL